MGSFNGITYKAPKRGLCAYEKYYPEINDEGVNDLYVTCEIVFNTYFLYIHDPQLKEDMWSEGIVKALEFIKSGAFDPTRGSLKNIIYTIIRNSMKNVVYRSGRDFPSDDEIMNTNPAASVQVSMSRIEIPDDIFNCLKRCSDEVIEEVKSSLNNLGFITSSKDNTYYPEVERYCSLIIWRKLR